MPCVSTVARRGSIRTVPIADGSLLSLLLPSLQPKAVTKSRCRSGSPSSSTSSCSWRQAEALFFLAIRTVCRGQVHKHKARSHRTLPTQPLSTTPRFGEFGECEGSSTLKAHGSRRQPVCRARSQSFNDHTSRRKRRIQPLLQASNAKATICRLQSGVIRQYTSHGQERSFSQGFRRNTQASTPRAFSQVLPRAVKTPLAHWSGLIGGIKTRRGTSFWEDISKKEESETEQEAGDELPPSLNLRTSTDNITKNDDSSASRIQQLSMLHKIRYLEWRLRNARQELKASLDDHEPLSLQMAASHKASLINRSSNHLVKLTKEDYVNMVDLYYYLPQKDSISSPTYSPNPLLFKESTGESLSKRFDVNRDMDKDIEAELDNAIDPEFHAKAVSEMEDLDSRFRDRSLSSNSLLEPFINLLLRKYPPPGKLFRLYQRFPHPGVAYLPSSAIRLLLHRMSTHKDKRSGANMLRYLSIIEDMQSANLPITVAEWSSAIYLGGRAFCWVTEPELNRSIEIWKRMEQDAGVQASNVTFNIIFDIAVKAKKYVFADRILQEMFDRKLHLNRLGRVSFIWYQGWLGDGDAVRRAYRDFVDAGEIVDTLVLNCVMVSLIRTQEPIAAEQIYERMKALQSDVRKFLFKAHKQQKKARYEKEGLPTVVQYPPPGSGMLNDTYASNSLGRILLKAADLATTMPEFHQKLQSSMPMVPDSITFRILIDHYAVTAGEMNRLCVILNDMTDFGVCLDALHFKLMFKGFYNHGGSRYSKWGSGLLNVLWQACLTGMKREVARNMHRRGFRADKQGVTEEFDSEGDEEEEDQGIEWTDGDESKYHASQSSQKAASDQSNNPNEDSEDYSDHPWRDFIREFTGVDSPRPTYYQPATFMKFDSPENQGTTSSSSEDSAPSPFFTSPIIHKRSLPGSDDASPAMSRRAKVPFAKADEEADSDPSSFLPLPGFLESLSDNGPPRYIKPSMSLIRWILRAHAKVDGRRQTVEDVWWECKQVYKPKNEFHKEKILMILESCLEECDRKGSQTAIL